MNGIEESYKRHGINIVKNTDMKYIMIVSSEMISAGNVERDEHGMN
jgi:hypothetical protein